MNARPHAVTMARRPALAERCQHVRSGKLVALGMVTAQHSKYAAALPTLTERGLAIESNSWNGLLTRAGTPEPVLARLNAELQRALAAPAAAQAFQEGGISAPTGTAAQFAASIRSKTDKHAQVIRRAGITSES